MHISAKNYIKRFISLIIGLMFAAYGITLTVNSNLGASPWDVFSQGVAFQLSKITGTEILIGTTISWIGWIILILSVMLKEKIGVGTIYDILIVGHIINFCTIHNLIPVAENNYIRFFMLIMGFVIWSFGVYLYLSAGLGAGPRDGLMSAFSKKGINIVIAKNSIEAIVLVIGWFMGGTIGIGTIIAVFIMGFLLKFWFNLFNFNLANTQNESVAETFGNIKNLIYCHVNQLQISKS